METGRPTVLQAKYPDNALEKLYDTKSTNNVISPELEELLKYNDNINDTVINPDAVVLSPTEHCLINIFRDYSKINRQKLIDYANQLKNEE